MTQEQIDAVIIAHYKWVARLATAVELGESEFSPETVRMDNQCELGRWIDEVADSDGKRSSELTAIKVLHAKFHESAADILENAIRGKRDEAKLALASDSEFRMLSRALIFLLLSFKNKSSVGMERSG